jgi:hypothetical protein
MAGAYRTQTDLILQALKNLGVLSAGNAADPEDEEFVRENVDPMIRTLASLDICYIGDPDNISGELFLPLAAVLADMCASKFGSTAEDQAALNAKGLGTPPGTGAGALMLRQINRGRPTYETLRTQSF